MKKRAIIYCESQFRSMDGKTANGLIREPVYMKLLLSLIAQKKDKIRDNS